MRAQIFWRSDLERLRPGRLVPLAFGPCVSFAPRAADKRHPSAFPLFQLPHSSVVDLRLHLVPFVPVCRLALGARAVQLVLARLAVLAPLLSPVVPAVRYRWFENLSRPREAFAAPVQPAPERWRDGGAACLERHVISSSALAAARIMHDETVGSGQLTVVEDGEPFNPDSDRHIGRAPAELNSVDAEAGCDFSFWLPLKRDSALPSLPQTDERRQVARGGSRLSRPAAGYDPKSSQFPAAPAGARSATRRQSL